MSDQYDFDDMDDTRQVESVNAKNKTHAAVGRLREQVDAEIADLRRQLETAKLSEQYAMQTVVNLHKEVAELRAERDMFSKQTAVLWKAVRAVQDLIDQSQGVYGLHLNGEGAPWETLRKGGQFEEWLFDFDDALESGGEE